VKKSKRHQNPLRELTSHIRRRDHLQRKRHRILSKWQSPQPTKPGAQQRGTIPKGATIAVDTEIEKLGKKIDELRRRFRVNPKQIKSNKLYAAATKQIMRDARKAQTLSAHEKAAANAINRTVAKADKEARRIIYTADPVTDVNPLPKESGQDQRILSHHDIDGRLAEKGWSKRDWATNSKVDAHTVRDYMNGRSRPTPLTRKKIAEALGVSPQSLPESLLD
jgi:ribosome-binding protein aMBF1 (putative translation factor)